MLRKKILILALVLFALSPVKVQADEIHTAKATAYCLTGTTATGTQTKASHTVASKPEWFGKIMVVWEDGGDHAIHPENYIGTYTVEDTGSENIRKGYVIDVYIPEYEEAKKFGSKNVLFQLIDAEG